MTNTSDTSRAEFEAWLRTVCFQTPTPEAYDLAKSAWQAARANSIDSQLDSNTLKKMTFLSESKKSMRPVGVVLIDDATGQRATIDMGRVTWADPTTEDSSAVQPEPVIDGYPLRSGLPPAIETSDLINRLQAFIGDAESHEWKSVSVANIRAAIAAMAYDKFGIVADDADIVAFARYIMAAQADNAPFQPDWANYRQGLADGKAEAIEAMQAARDDVLDSALYDALAEQLGYLYSCGRTWSAWSVGTMSEDDFSLASEDDDIVANFVNAARTAIATSAAKEAP